jgi:hypothetical protein
LKLADISNISRYQVQIIERSNDKSNTDNIMGNNI